MKIKIQSVTSGGQYKILITLTPSIGEYIYNLLYITSIPIVIYILHVRDKSPTFF